MISRLFIFEFFQGAAIALYFIAAISIFVDHLPPTELPKVFILSAFLLWLFGFIYSKLEHGYLTRHIIYFVLTFNALCIVLFRLFIDLQTERWFLFLFLGAFNILYLLNNLEFWGLVSLLYDVRQSKRLFAIVSAWDGPARMVGYGIAFVFATIIGPENLLWIAAVFMGCSFLLFIPLARSYQMRDLAPKHHHHYATQNIQQIQTAITGNKLVSNVALVSFLSFCFYLVTNFVLYGYVKKQFHSDTSLARFFAIFLVISRGLTLILKPLFINRLLDRLGLKKSLLIAPIFLLIVSFISILISGGQSAKPSFYIFMVMAISADILRSSIQSPVLLATLQPLPTPQRLRAHTIIKGLMDPFAFLATGIVLLLFAANDSDINLEMLSVLLFIVAILWMYFSFSVDSNYIKTLTVAIQKRILNERDISITDTNSLNFLLNRIEKGNEEEVVAVLNVVSSQPVNREKFFLKALGHKSAKIKQVSLRYIQVQQCFSTLPELKKMLREEEDLPVLPQLVKTIASLDNTEDLSSYFTHENQEVANAAIMAWLSQENVERKKIAEDHIVGLFESGQLREVINALHIVGELKARKFANQVATLIGHDESMVRYQAVQTAGKLASDSLLKSLLNAYVKAEHIRDLLEALQLASEAAVPHIRHLLQTQTFSQDKRLKLFALTGRIGGKSAANLIEESLSSFPQDTPTLLATLYQLHFTTESGGGLYKNLLSESQALASYIVHAREYLKNEQGDYGMIIQAFDIELNVLRTKCIWLFSFLYDGEKIRRAKSGLDVNTKESIANSYELIQMTVAKEYALPFIILFEQTDFSYTSGQLKKFFKTPLLSVQAITKRVMADEPQQFNDWTKACFLYMFKNRPGLLDEETVAPYRKSDNIILKETAAWVSEGNKLF